ncbi:sensor histidine kinase [Microbispora hainanensis]|uniref:histidine kinase n=1 Tax=Microbispora hainanensis TaxID=568844 RepID=A0A544YPY4_9ACTN|nr:HAMP domain-containing sensor histidine kinase [Microbispora hainanensis]TQS18835.1 HAMP domain-containing histidine kinase [Microbispora hainanensis]
MGVRLSTTLTATAAVAAALCLASIALFAALDSSLTASTKELAANDAKEQMHVLKAESGPGDAVGEKGTVSPFGKGALPPGGKGPMPGSAAAGEDDGLPVPDEAMFMVRRTFETENGPVTVIGRASMAPATAAMATLRNLLIPGVPALLAVVALFTWLAVGRVLRPVSAIRAKVADITANGLHERVPEPDTRDEIAALARTVNATLDRLQTSVDAQRQFVADAAHELRSPLAILRTRLELARPAEKPLATAALDDVARLQSLAADLLLLARLDAGEPLSRAGELDLAQVVAEEAVRKRPRPDVHVCLDLTPGLLLDGSADQLRRLVANLVDNAVRHASASVHVTLMSSGDHAVLDVVDDGPGIPPEHHTTVFERFARLDHARTRDTGGSGLGLPIARNIARAHGGTVQVVPHSPGARLRAVFPLPERSVASVAYPPGDLAVRARV